MIATTPERPATPECPATKPGQQALLREPLPDSFAIETPRLLLRPVSEQDEEALSSLVVESLPQLRRWLVWCRDGYSRESCRDWIRKVVGAWRESRDFALAMVERASGRLVGATGLNRIDAVGRWGNLGYWLRTDATRQGYATEAAAAVARFGFTVLGLHRIEIVADVENVASRRVAEKLGATLEGIARNRALVDGVNHDAAVYSLIPGDL